MQMSLLLNVWFQKISRPPPWRELEIPGGRGGQRSRKFQRGGGLDIKITFRRGKYHFIFDLSSNIASY